MAKVLLIEPFNIDKKKYIRSKGSFGRVKANFLRPPLDLMIIGGFLIKNGHTVKITDANVLGIAAEELKQEISRFSPDYVVISTSTPTLYSDLKVANYVKEINKGTITIAIGIHIMALPEETIKLCSDLDICIYDEPELPILDLANGKRPENIKGIVFRKGKRIIKNKNGRLIEDLDELGMPCHDKVPIGRYKDPTMKREPMTAVLFSRGCINKCIFCSSTFYNHYRQKTVKASFEELDWISNSLKIKEVKFWDNGLTYNSKWLNSLLDNMLKNKIDLTWCCSTRVDKLNLDLLNKMKKAGCHTVHLGIESSSNLILKNAKKNITKEMTELGVQKIKKSGLDVAGFFILGLPGETAETIKETVNFAKSLGLDYASFNIATPHPGTEFYDYLKENNLLVESNWAKYTPSYSIPVYKLKDLSREQLSDLVKKAFRSFYFRPLYALTRLSKLTTITRLKSYLLNTYSLIRNIS